MISIPGPNGWRRSRRVTTVVTVAGALALGMAAPVPASAAAGCGVPATRLSAARLTTAAVPAGTSVLACGLIGRVIVQGDAGVTVPPPGHGVAMSGLRVDGGAIGFQVVVDSAGRISYPVPQMHGIRVAAAAAPSACTDGFWLVKGWRVSGPYRWYIGDGGMPGALSQSAARVAFQDAIDNITLSFNNCNYTDQVPATEAYQGTTTFEADISSAGSCTPRDGKSTWDAGDLPASSLAVTCTFFTKPPTGFGTVDESDTRYNTTDHDFTDNPTSTCSNKYDVRGVGTHEAGHTFGLADLPAGHENLTMSGTLAACTTAARTLGSGDVLGLRDLY